MAENQEWVLLDDLARRYENRGEYRLVQVTKNGGEAAELGSLLRWTTVPRRVDPRPASASIQPEHFAIRGSSATRLNVSVAGRSQSRTCPTFLQNPPSPENATLYRPVAAAPAYSARPTRYAPRPSRRLALIMMNRNYRPRDRAYAARAHFGRQTWSRAAVREARHYSAGESGESVGVRGTESSNPSLSTIQSARFRPFRRIDRNPRVCPRFAIPQGPGERLLRLSHCPTNPTE